MTKLLYSLNSIPEFELGMEFVRPETIDAHETS